MSVSSGSGGFTEPAGMFTGTVNLPTSLFTGVPFIDDMTIASVSNSTKFIAQGAPGGARTADVLRAGGGLGGSGPLEGFLFFNFLALVNAAVPLSPIGNTDHTTTLNAGTIHVTVVGTGWTTGAVTITGVTTTNGDNTLTYSGYDNRTPGHGGVVQLVSPFKAILNIGNLPGLATQTLSFSGEVPEAGTLVLLGTGVAALVLLARRRR